MSLTTDTTLDQTTGKQSSGSFPVVKVYPFGTLAIALLINYFVIGISPLKVGLPSEATLIAMSIAAALLVINHSWLMTATELTRNRHKLYATPEEWTSNEARPAAATAYGRQELERNHNAHRNSTENTAVAILPLATLALASAPPLAAQLWITGFAVGRLGHAYGYLAGKDGLRGLFMTVSLLCTYGAVSYLLMAAMSLT